MKPTQAAGLSVASNSVLVALKLTAGLMMGSVSVLSEAIHSGLDLLASVIALFSVTKSSKPPDNDHAFGHGKIENVSALLEALLIFVAALWIIAEAIQKIRHGVEVESLGIGLVVMGISAGANLVISRILFKTAKAYDSQALHADGLHLQTDVYTAAGVFVGLGAISLTHIGILDPLVAIGVALLIIKASWDLTRESFMPLLDVRFPEEEEKELVEILEAFRSEFIDVHEIRTRKAGPERHIDLHMDVDGEISVFQSHDLTDRMQAAILIRWPRAFVLIHVEPVVVQQGPES